MVPLPAPFPATMVLDTTEFDRWEVAVASRLGHHRSQRLADDMPFQARMTAGAVGAFTALHLQGRGRLRLVREQCGDAVLWLPLVGLSQETINGTAWLAEPGMGLLFRPGDQMDGLTSREMAGISVLIPPDALPSLPARIPPLLHGGVLTQHLLAAARELAAAVTRPPAGAEHVAAAFAEALQQWGLAHDPATGAEGVSARRRAATVASAREWMGQHLAEPFQARALARAVGVSIRTLQYSFQAELGCTPMAELKRLRLRQLRRDLLDPRLRDCSVSALMVEAGLVASGASAADYRRWCGELPRQTRRG